MSQPTPYTTTTDFSQQESINASGRSTVNTAALDAELANIETTLDQTLANLTLLQRDDGKLNDTIVEVRTLDQSVLTLMGGFNLRGLWATGSIYNVNDISSNGTYTYVCAVGHTAGAVFDAANWIQFGFTSGADAAAAAAAAQVSAEDADDSAVSAAASSNAASLSASAASAQAAASAASASTATTKAAEASASATASANSAATAATLVIGASGVPAGVLIQFAGPTPPAGYLAVPTAPATLSRATYAALFSAIGTTWGAGDGSTTFGMPYCPNGYVFLQGSLGAASVGQLLTHAHQQTSTGSSGASYVTARIIGATGTETGDNNSTMATGGSANLAAGIGSKFCIKY